MSSPNRTNQGVRWRLTVRWIVPPLVLCAFALCLRPILFPSAHQRLLRRAATSYVLERYAEAEDLANRVLEQAPDCSSALLIAGEAATKQQRSEDALSYFSRVSHADQAAFVQAQCSAAKRQMILGRADEAERCLRRALEVNPRHTKSNERLAVFLQIAGRTFESLPHVYAWIESGQCTRDQLMMIGAPNVTLLDDPPFIQACLRTVPENPAMLLGQARLDILDNRMDQAEETLKRIVAADPHALEAQARLGEILIEKQDSTVFLDWHADLPPEADAHPGIWYLRGVWARRNDQQRAAVRCFLEALELDPNSSSANYQMSQTMVAIGEAERARQFGDRAGRLSKVEYFISELKGESSLLIMRQLVDLMEQLGRIWEATGWCYVMLYIQPDSSWAKEKLDALRPKIEQLPAFTMISARPARALNRADYPLPDWSAGRAAAAEHTSRGPVSGNVRFDDQAAQVGLQFDYFNGTTVDTGLEHMLQSTGGGVAVIDYDQDSWPDLYFSQSGPWTERGQSSEYRDRLFRNLGNGRFEDVTDQAGLGDGSFGQGIAVGDYNSDGFPDLYVGNIGPNRLYANNGDGTFRDVTAEAGVGGDVWTVSSAIVDLNGDAHPEIYAVSYLILQEVLDRMCQNDGRPMGCSPSIFTAEQDRLYHNLGNGRFRDVTERCGIEVPDGKGLGVVAANFEKDGRVHLFVGNDTTANFHFVNQTKQPGGPLQFEEQSLYTGLGLDATGSSQSCMGIAVGDVDNNGLLDMFVTNFYGDSNTLYAQVPGLIFNDHTRSYALREPGFNMLGFGTQMLDSELDGWPDILVANGHVDRTISTGVPDLMPPQYYRNDGNGKFTELSGQSLGGYFQGEYLGRSVVVLDWNKDGCPDVCISHLDAPVALLTNQTEDVGHFVAIKLCGVDSNRDAIGAVLTLKADGQTWTRQIVGGDGYLASNQRYALFGLGDTTAIEELRIDWPSGREQSFRKLDCDLWLTIVEGRDQLNRQPR